jgi:hypothetical protein
MSLVAIDWNPDAKTMRKFGISTMLGCAAIGAFLYFGIWPAAKPSTGFGAFIWIAGALTGVTALLGPRIGKPLYCIWMGIGYVVGNIVSRLVLAMVFYLLITPMGLVMRLIGRDPLQLRKKEAETFWQDIPQANEDGRYERQF